MVRVCFLRLLVSFARRETHQRIVSFVQGQTLRPVTVSRVRRSKYYRPNSAFETVILQRGRLIQYSSDESESDAEVATNEDTDDEEDQATTGSAAISTSRPLVRGVEAFADSARQVLESTPAFAHACAAAQHDEADNEEDEDDDF